MAKVSIRRYGTGVIVVHWLLVLLMIPLLLTGLVLMREWAIHEFNIVGAGELPAIFNYLSEFHAYFGAAILALGLVHFLIHIRQKDRPIIPKNIFSDFKASIHTLFYVFHLASRGERGSAGKYKANQKMVYIGTIYAIALSGLTALLIIIIIVLAPFLGYLPTFIEEVLKDIPLLLHITAGVIILCLVLYRVLYLLRTHDAVSVKCILFTGKMPEWYVKKNHFQWYKQVKGGYSVPREIELKKRDVIPEEEVSG